jgi:hypothetical protein
MWTEVWEWYIRVYINRRVCYCVLIQHFWSQVSRIAIDIYTLVDSLGHAKVSDFDKATLIQQQVVGLDVRVYQAVVVQMPQSLKMYKRAKG